MPSAVREEKTQAERITECMTILRKMTGELGILASNPSIIVLKKRMAQYWRDGKLYEDKLPLYGYDRYIVYRFPQWANQEVEVTLRVSKTKNMSIPPDLEEEIRVPRPPPPPSYPEAAPPAQTNSETQSGPSHPSPQDSGEK